MKENITQSAQSLRGVREVFFKKNSVISTESLCSLCEVFYG